METAGRDYRADHLETEEDGGDGEESGWMADRPIIFQERTLPNLTSSLSANLISDMTAASLLARGPEADGLNIRLSILLTYWVAPLA